MTRKFPDWLPAGVIPAVVLPFEEDYAIDEGSYRKHLRDVVAVPGVSAVTTNAHSCEVHALGVEEQRRVLDLTLDEVGDRVPVVSGVYADGSHLAAQLARMADAGGASALLVFPPQSLGMGGQLRPEMALAHFETIAAASDLPLILFEYPLSGPLGYPFETLLKICEAVPQVRAIKDWCGDPMAHERHIRTFQALPRRVNVLSTHSAWLMSSLVMGCAGLLSGAGSVIADLQAALFSAVGEGDLGRAQALNDRIYPMVQAFYAPPFLDMHNRMKEVLVLLGRLPRAVVRPPLMKLPPAEIERLKRAIEAAGLGRERDLPAAAE
jgi:4-hydroxy-tetrahydrodipicolinate synthase